MSGASAVSPTLAALAAARGVERDYWQATGEHMIATPEHLAAILRALGVELASVDDAGAALEALEAERASQAGPACAVVWGRAELRFSVGAGVHAGVLQLEDGTERRLTISDGAASLAGPVPHGYHTAELHRGAERARVHVIAAPERAFGAPEEAGKRWGVFAPLYALRSAHTLGAGDLSDLGRLGALVRRHGGSVVGTLPLLAGFFDEPLEISPYGPASRLFWNEVYLDLEQLGAAPPDPATAAHLAGLELVDYRAQSALVRARLEPLARRAWDRDRAALEAYTAETPELDGYARFRARTERHRAFYDAWPAGDEFTADDESARRYHVYVQRELSRQLGRLGAEIDLYLDLPVCVHRGGYDVWRHPELFAHQASIGAPPDELFRSGQDWGAPPLDPLAMQREGHAHFRAMVVTLMRHAAVLRVDHVMGLHRLYWIPRGAGAKEGVYVRYPAEELYAVMVLESHRHQCALVGEDLGTVPDYVRPMMEHHGLHRLYVGQFAIPDHDAAHWEEPPASSVASLNTHDMPTFAGFWQGREIEERVELGLIDLQTAGWEHGRREAQREVALRRFAVGDDPVGEVMRGMTVRLAAAAARLVLLALEDLWLEPRPQNIPGTGAELDNWRRRMTRSLEEIEADPMIAGLLDAVNAARGQ